MTAQPLRIGFAGANTQRGWATDAHLSAVRAIPGLTVSAVSARTQDVADDAAKLYGAQSAYLDSLALARDTEVDIVAVTVKVPEHRAIVLAALEAGKHVYCEWPLGRDTAEADEMKQAACAAGVHVVIGLQGAHAVAVRHAARAVQQGQIGRPRSLNVVSPTAGWGAQAPAQYAYLQDRRNGATLVSIPGGHTLAAVEEVAGPYIEVMALKTILTPRMRLIDTGKTIERTSPDHLVVTGRHNSGCVSVVEIVGGTMDTPFRFELRGERGRVTISGAHIGGYQAGDLVATIEPGCKSQPAPEVSGLSGPSANVAELWSAFACDIRADTRTVPDFECAVRLHRLLDTIAESAETGRRMTLPVVSG